jgi:predicted permease
MLLLVACANVAQLFLARGLSRGREMAVRRALGAGTGVLVGQLLVETLLVGLAGGAVGLGLGWLGLRGFLALTPDALPRQAAIAVDLRVVAFVAGVAIVTALVFGLLPAVRSVRRDVADTLRGSDRGATAGRRIGALRRGLIVGEVALSLVLVAGAGLLLRSFLSVSAQDPGFQVADVWTVPLSLTSIEEPEAWMSTMADIGEAAARAPGVESVAYGLTMPLTSGGGRCCWRSPVTAEGDASESPMIHPVNTSYFHTLGIPLVTGRVWTDGEARADPAPVVVSERLATELWGGSDAALHRPLEMNRLSMTVVGVAGDTHHYGLEDVPDAGLYVPVARLPFPIDRAHLAVRMRPGSSAGVGRDLRQAVWSAAPDVPVPVVRAMDEWLTLETSGRRFDSAVFATFGALALLLAAGGLYGTMLHLAGQRTRELGIRMALGASRARIERELVTGGVGMAVLGVGVGLGGAWALGRFLESRLWGVGAGDPSTLALAALLLLATAALASWIPARRAGRTDPVKTLRVE